MKMARRRPISASLHSCSDGSDWYTCSELRPFLRAPVGELSLVESVAYKKTYESQVKTAENIYF